MSSYIKYVDFFPPQTGATRDRYAEIVKFAAKEGWEHIIEIHAADFRKEVVPRVDEIIEDSGYPTQGWTACAAGGLGNFCLFFDNLQIATLVKLSFG